ncbi:F0F1 ATP synthase subunit B' [uncultured Helicobacter sp.]|mgnify:CR=1 FL=1
MEISVNVNLMILVFCCFILLLFLLNQWLYKPMIAFMNKRDEMIKRDLQDTQGNLQEITKIQEEIAKIIGNAQREAKEIIEEATAKEKALLEEKLAEKKAEIDSKMLVFRQDLAKQQEELKNELSMHIGEYKQIIRRKLEQV